MMDLGVTSIITALNSMNFTANCSASVDWLNLQGSLSPDSNAVFNTSELVNTAFLRAALPPEFRSLSYATISDFYGQLASLQPYIWLRPASESIQAGCRAPELVQDLSFEDIDLSRDCVATAKYYGNTLCAINGPQQSSSDGTLWTVEGVGDYQWLQGTHPIQGLNSTAGLAMLRSALPNQYKNILDVELGTWTSPAATATDNNTSQGAKICKACMPEFCAAAAFTGNPDIGGIGVSFEHQPCD
jgi:hypothetical protein